jgi:hypothetical protein
MMPSTSSTLLRLASILVVPSFVESNLFLRQPRIIGGTEATSLRYPYTVARDNKIKIDDYPQIRLVLIARQFYGLTVSLSSSGAKTEKMSFQPGNLTFLL